MLIQGISRLIFGLSHLIFSLRLHSDAVWNHIAPGTLVGSLASNLGFIGGA
jgi:hypothetical protein